MRDIGKNIRTLREQRELTQEELAQRLFVTRQTVSNYETGRSRPDLEMLVKIAQVLETDVNQVLYGLPPEQDRQREAKKLGIGCLMTAGIFLLVTLPVSLLRPFLLRAYAGFPLFMGLSALLKPALWLVLGWCALQVAGLARVVRPLGTFRWVTWTRRGILLLLAAYVVLFLPPLAVGAIQVVQAAAGLTGQALAQVPQIPVYTRLMNRLLWFNVLYTPVYAIAGGVLWLFRFPKS